MNYNPQQLLNHFHPAEYDIRTINCNYSGGGIRHSIFKDGKMIINQLTISPHGYAPSHLGYLNMKYFQIKDLRPEEISNINKSKTMRISNLSFNRLQQLLAMI